MIHSAAFRLMLTTVKVVKIECPDDVLPVYQAALDSDYSTIVVENL